MATKDRDIWQPQWVALPILDFVRLVHQFGDDTESLGQWVKRFSDDLLFCNTDSEDELTRRLLEDAKEKVQKLSTAGKKGGKASAKARKQKQKSQEVAGNSNAPDESATALEEYYDQETDQISTNNQRGYNTANDESGIGPKPDSHLNGDASSGDAGDRDITRESADPDRTTISNSNGSCSPEDGTNIDWHEAVCQALGTTDGNDQETEALQSQTGAGAAPLQNDSFHNAPAPRFPRKSKPPKNAEEVRNFAADHALDVEDARDWYEMNYVERPGCDKDGVAIENWKGHCTAYCRTAKEKRESA